MELKKSSGAGAGSLLTVFTEAVSTDWGGVAVRFGVTLDPCFFVGGFSLLAADAGKRVALITILPSNEGTTSAGFVTSYQTTDHRMRQLQLHVFLKDRLKRR